MWTLFLYYFFGGSVFYIVLWAWKAYNNILVETKYDKWVARMSLTFPLWPTYLLTIIAFFVFRLFKKLIKLSEF